MFNQSIFRSFFALTLVCLFNFSFASTPLDDDMMVTLRAGTAVSLTLNEAFSADQVAVGNTVDFMVRSDVTVNGKVVIAAGSIAEGWVKSVKSKCDKKCKCSDSHCSTITITVESVQAVDGQRINLRSIPHIIKAPCCHENANANIGTNLSARVLNDKKINA
jgi:hypothetical protein